jgi:hypothetical protein
MSLRKRKMKRKKIELHLIGDDYSKGGLLQVYESGQTTVGVITPEIGNSIESNLFRCKAFICSMHSGESLRSFRISSGKLAADNKRLTISGATQRATANKWFFGGKNKHDFVSSGYIPRFGIAIVESKAGKRKAKVTNKETKFFNEYNKRITSMLEDQREYLYENTLQREKIRLSPEAEDALGKVFDHIEMRMQEGGDLFMHREVGSRFTEQIVRIAANIHKLEGIEGDISLSSIKNAFKIVSYYTDCYKVLFELPPRYIADAEELDGWFEERYRNFGEYYVLKNEARQLSPGALRKDGRFYSALAHLVKTKRVYIVANKNKEWIYFKNPVSPTPSQSRMNTDYPGLGCTGFFV